MNSFGPFQIKIEFKGQTLLGVVSPFSGTRNNLPSFFRISFNNNYWEDLSFQDGYWKGFNEGIDKELMEAVTDFIQVYYQ
jgi:hypothetical protein